MASERWCVALPRRGGGTRAADDAARFFRAPPAPVLLKLSAPLSLPSEAAEAPPTPASPAALPSSPRCRWRFRRCRCRAPRWSLARTRLEIAVRRAPPGLDCCAAAAVAADVISSSRGQAAQARGVAAAEKSWGPAPPARTPPKTSSLSRHAGGKNATRRKGGIWQLAPSEITDVKGHVTAYGGAMFCTLLRVSYFFSLLGGHHAAPARAAPSPVAVTGRESKNARSLLFAPRSITHSTSPARGYKPCSCSRLSFCLCWLCRRSRRLCIYRRARSPRHHLRRDRLPQPPRKHRRQERRRGSSVAYSWRRGKQLHHMIRKWSSC